MPEYSASKHGAAVIPPLLPEQVRDAKFLATYEFAADFSEPGAGKTLTALEAAWQVNGYGRWLLIVPPISLRMWTRLARAYRLANGDVGAVWLLDSSRTPEVRGALASQIIVTTYAIAAKLAEQLAAWAPNVLILDEAHALKSTEAKRTKAVLDVIVPQCGACFALTGTPILRHNDDLYPLLKALAPDLLEADGTSGCEAFRAMYTKTAALKFHARQWKPKVVSTASRNTERLSSLLYGGHPNSAIPFAVRRITSELVTMPPVTFEDIWVDFHVTSTLVTATAQIEDFTVDSPALATVRRELGVAKATAVATFCLERKRPLEGMLILYWHKDVGNALEVQLRPHGTIARIDGSTSANDKAKAEEGFNDGMVDFLLANMASAGVSLNLQRGGTTAVFAELDWSPGVIEQAYKRLWRMGQTKCVQVFFCLADHDADHAAYGVAVGKTANIETLNEGTTP